MCEPRYFEVRYAINPWMDPGRPVDPALAREQWTALVAAHRALGHTVDIVEPVPGLPDMVFAANAGLVLGGQVLAARFRAPQRQPETLAYERWFKAAGLGVREPQAVCEGEGDLVPVGGVLLAGTGFRTEPAAHREAAELFGREVVTLHLTDPLFYHLDTALFALDDRNVAYFPDAFAPDSRTELAHRFPDAVLATRADAEAFGLNAVSDGRHVVLPRAATGLAARLAERGYVPVPVDLSELQKAGGSAKCCTLEIREARP
jgi:N-dimethylarginine dimethylaminohydrolase